MHRISSILALSVALAASAAWAQDDYSGDTSSDQGGTSGDQAGQPADETAPPADEGGAAGDEAGAAGQPPGTTVATGEEITKGMLQDEKFGVRPQVGTIIYKDQIADTASRFAAGLTLDMDAISSFVGRSPWYVGPSTGIIYSHLGAAGSNWFGTDADTSIGSAGANFLYIPANLKAGYNIADNYRVAVHGGGNVTYRSSGESMNLGAATAVANPTWRIYPNIGLDLEANMAKNVALTLRPDYTFTPGSNFFTGTLALAIGLG